jgi:hypothetical protein
VAHAAIVHRCGRAPAKPARGQGDGVVNAVSAIHEGTYEAAATAAGSTVFTAGAVLTVRRFFGPGLAIGWGDNRYNLNNPSAVQSPVAGLACGNDFNLFLHGNGLVSSYGGLDAARNAPPVWLSNVTAISAGVHRMALRADGVVVVWGPFYEYFGSNGAPPGLNDVVAIAAGLYHCLALKRDGSVVAWNGNFDRYGETYVPEGLNGVVAIAAGGYHSVAVKADGTVVAWGRNDLGQCNVPAGLTKWWPSRLASVRHLPSDGMARWWFGDPMNASV